MMGATGEVLYVGKARDLKKRLSSYFRNNLETKTQILVGQIRDIIITVTHNEAEALLLENTLIKQEKPRYNILLKDDKSYPYIYLSQQDFPRFGFYRGNRKLPGTYFGPFPSAAAVRETLNLLQKLFPVRQCEDSIYRNRSRPCLQYQLQRCSAPCVGFVTQPQYQEHIRQAVMFLEGKSQELMNHLVAKMEQASAALAYEEAALLRDKIAKIHQIQATQHVDNQGGDIDVVACALNANYACIQLFYIRQGRNLGNKVFFPQHVAHHRIQDILAAFIPQHYLGKEIPRQILINAALPEVGLLTEVLSAQCGHAVSISHPVRGRRAKWTAMAEANAAMALEQHISNKKNYSNRWQVLGAALKLAVLPARMECIDISHTMGEATVASCVVFDRHGPVKSMYRRYNLKNITPGDDYAAMAAVVDRRFKKMLLHEAALPEVLFIDGGHGQVKKAHDMLQALGIQNILCLGIAKGPRRKAGEETLYLSDGTTPFLFDKTSPALHLIQQIRDEAHRFAISAHRQQRAKTRQTSVLEDIPGVGPKRRRELLRHFGGFDALARAGIEDMSKVPGINKNLAQKIYDTIHQ